MKLEATQAMRDLFADGMAGIYMTLFTEIVKTYSDEAGPNASKGKYANGFQTAAHKLIAEITGSNVEAIRRNLSRKRKDKAETAETLKAAKAVADENRAAFVKANKSTIDSWVTAADKFGENYEEMLKAITAGVKELRKAKTADVPAPPVG